MALERRPAWSCMEQRGTAQIVANAATWTRCSICTCAFGATVMAPGREQLHRLKGASQSVTWTQEGMRPDHTVPDMNRLRHFLVIRHPKSRVKLHVPRCTEPAVLGRASDETEALGKTNDNIDQKCKGSRYFLAPSGCAGRRDLMVSTAQRSCRSYLLSPGDCRDTSGGRWGGDCTDSNVHSRMDFRE